MHPRILALIGLSFTITTLRAQETVRYSMNNGVAAYFPFEPVVYDTTSFRYATNDLPGLRLLFLEEYIANYSYDRPVSNKEQLEDMYRFFRDELLKVHAGNPGGHLAGRRCRAIVIAILRPPSHNRPVI